MEAALWRCTLCWNYYMRYQWTGNSTPPWCFLPSATVLHVLMLAVLLDCRYLDSSSYQSLSLHNLKALSCEGALSSSGVLKPLIIYQYMLCLRGACPASWINLFLLLLSSVEFMSVGSECEEELQEERGLSQLETRLQHRSEHVRPAQVRTLTGQCSRSLVGMSWFYWHPVTDWIQTGNMFYYYSCFKGPTLLFCMVNFIIYKSNIVYCNSFSEHIFDFLPSSQPEVSLWRIELAFDKKFHCSKQFYCFLSKSLLDSAFKHTPTSKN